MSVTEDLNDKVNSIVNDLKSNDPFSPNVSKFVTDFVLNTLSKPLKLSDIDIKEGDVLIESKRRADKEITKFLNVIGLNVKDVSEIESVFEKPSFYDSVLSSLAPGANEGASGIDENLCLDVNLKVTPNKCSLKSGHANLDRARILEEKPNFKSKYAELTFSGNQTDALNFEPIISPILTVSRFQLIDVRAFIILSKYCSCCQQRLKDLSSLYSLTNTGINLKSEVQFQKDSLFRPYVPIKNDTSGIRIDSVYSTVIQTLDDTIDEDDPSVKSDSIETPSVVDSPLVTDKSMLYEFQDRLLGEIADDISNSKENGSEVTLETKRKSGLRTSKEILNDIYYKYNENKNNNLLSAKKVDSNVKNQEESIGKVKSYWLVKESVKNHIPLSEDSIADNVVESECSNELDKALAPIEGKTKSSTDLTEELLPLLDDAQVELDEDEKILKSIKKLKKMLRKRGSKKKSHSDKRGSTSRRLNKVTAVDNLPDLLKDQVKTGLNDSLVKAVHRRDRKRRRVLTGGRIPSADGVDKDEGEDSLESFEMRLPSSIDRSDTVYYEEDEVLDVSYSYERIDSYTSYEAPRASRKAIYSSDKSRLTVTTSNNLAKRIDVAGNSIISASDDELSPISDSSIVKIDDSIGTSSEESLTLDSLGLDLQTKEERVKRKRRELPLSYKHFNRLSGRDFDKCNNHPHSSSSRSPPTLKGSSSPLNYRSKCPQKYRSRSRSPRKYRSRSRSPRKYRSRSRSPLKYRRRSPISVSSRRSSPPKYKYRPRSPPRGFKRLRSGRSRSPPVKYRQRHRSKSPLGHLKEDSRCHDVSGLLSDSLVTNNSPIIELID